MDSKHATATVSDLHLRLCDGPREPEKIPPSYRLSDFPSYEFVNQICPTGHAAKNVLGPVDVKAVPFLDVFGLADMT